MRSRWNVFLPPPKPRCTETIIKKACDSLEHHCAFPRDMAILTQPHNGRACLPLLRAMRPRDASPPSNFSSSQVMIPPAQADWHALR
jgi:hypothetical protein